MEKLDAYEMALVRIAVKKEIGYYEECKEKYDDKSYWQQEINKRTVIYHKLLNEGIGDVKNEKN